MTAVQNAHASGGAEDVHFKQCEGGVIEGAERGGNAASADDLSRRRVFIRPQCRGHSDVLDVADQIAQQIEPVRTVVDDAFAVIAVNLLHTAKHTLPQFVAQLLERRAETPRVVYRENHALL